VNEADVLVRLERYSDIPIETIDVVVMTDGRYVSRRSDGTIMERRLTPSGVQRVGNEVFGTGLFGQDQSYGCQPAPGTTIPTNRGYEAIAFYAWSETRTVRVSTMLVVSGEESLWAPCPARDALVRLAERLRDPTWLPGSAWSDAEARAFQPSAYRLFTIVRARLPNDVLLPRLDAVEWPFSTSLLELGAPLTHRAGVRCEAITADDESLVRDALVRAGATVVTDPYREPWQTSLEGGPEGVVDVVGQWLWPHQASCAGADLV
jgi:hypothetical protein